MGEPSRWNWRHRAALRREGATAQSMAPGLRTPRPNPAGLGTGQDADADQLRAAGPALLQAAVGRLDTLAHPRGGWSDFWVEPGCSTSWVTAYIAGALAEVVDAPGVGSAQRGRAAGLAQAAADRLLATEWDGAWGWGKGIPVDADSTAWAAHLLWAVDRPVPERTVDFLARHLRSTGVGTYSDPATGMWTQPMPEVTAVALQVIESAGWLRADELDEHWAALGEGPVWTSHRWPGSAHPTALVMHARHRAGRRADDVEDPLTPDGSLRLAGTTEASGRLATVPAGISTFALADALWLSCLLGHPDPYLAMDLLQRQLPGGGWAGDAQLLVPAQADDRLPSPTSDARGAYTTATVLYAAVALLRALPLAPSGSADPARSQSHAMSGMTMIRDPRAGDATRPAGRDERWDAVIARAAEGGGIPPERGLEVFGALTRESLAAPSPWPSPQLSSLALGTPVELLAGPLPGLRFLCEVGDPRLPAPARLRSGLKSVEWTAQLLGMGEAWAGRRAQLLDSLAEPHLPVPDGSRFWLRAEVELPADGSPVLTAHLSLHAGDVDDWRSRLHTALRMLPSGGSIWPALACLRGAGPCHELGIGEMPGDRWGITVQFESDRWRPDVVGELLATCALSASLADLTPEIPGVIHAAHQGRRRAGIALRVDPMTGDVIELTTTVALPAPMLGRDVITDRVAAWLEQRGQDPAPLRASVDAVEPEWSGAAAQARMLGSVTLSAGRRGTSATVSVLPGPGVAASTD